MDYTKPNTNDLWEGSSALVRLTFGVIEFADAPRRDLDTQLNSPACSATHFQRIQRAYCRLSAGTQKLFTSRPSCPLYGETNLPVDFRYVLSATGPPDHYRSLDVRETRHPVLRRQKLGSVLIPRTPPPICPASARSRFGSTFGIPRSLSLDHFFNKILLMLIHFGPFFRAGGLRFTDIPPPGGSSTQDSSVSHSGLQGASTRNTGFSHIGQRGALNLVLKGEHVRRGWLRLGTACGWSNIDLGSTDLIVLASNNLFDQGGVIYLVLSDAVLKQAMKTRTRQTIRGYLRPNEWNPSDREC